MEAKNIPDKSRRRFLRNLGIAAAAVTVSACGGKKLTETSDTAKKREMTYRINPNTGDKVSLLGYGCMRFPTMGMKNGDESDQTLDQEAINKSVDYALEHGVNYFDTSPAYCRGFSEAALGEALSRHDRSDYYIATKLSNFAPETWSHEASVQMFENSLKYLRTDYVDYLLLHAIGMGGMENLNGRYIDNGILDYLLEQKAAGKIRNLGFSYHGDVEVFDHLLKLQDESKIHWDFVQIQLNYIDWLHAKEVNERNTNAEYLYGELSRRGIPAVIMEPLLGGRLANMPEPVVRRMKEMRPDDSVASWAFRYAGTPDGVLTVLSGMTYMDHLRDNLKTFSPIEPVDTEEDIFLQTVANEFLANDLVPCTDCKYCMPCPYGVNIPGVFGHYNACLLNGDAPSDSQDPDFQAARRRYLFGLDMEIPRLRQADMCIACGKCLLHCPQRIPIPDQMAKIAKYTETLKSYSDMS